MRSHKMKQVFTNEAEVLAEADHAETPRNGSVRRRAAGGHELESQGDREEDQLGIRTNAYNEPSIG